MNIINYRNHVVCSLLNLSSSTVQNAFEINPCCSVYQYFFFLLLSSIPLYGCTSACLSTHQLKYLFLVFVIMNKAATNLCVQFLFCV